MIKEPIYTAQGWRAFNRASFRETTNHFYRTIRVWYHDAQENEKGSWGRTLHCQDTVTPELGCQVFFFFFSRVAKSSEKKIEFEIFSEYIHFIAMWCGVICLRYRDIFKVMLNAYPASDLYRCIYWFCNNCLCIRLFI